MHVVMFADQHLETLGGAQVSMRLQRRFLERAGHTVTVVAPGLHGARARAAAPAVAEAGAAYADLPSVPITPDREYAFTWPGNRTDRIVDAALAARPPVDVVHVQADFWGAFTGHRFARRHGLPVVHTMHNRVDVGIAATTPFPSLVLRVLNAWQRRALGPAGADRGRDGWAYLRRFANGSDAVTAPSSHFARRLEEHGVKPAGRRGIPPHLDAPPTVPHVDVVWNGIDDDILDATLAQARAESRVEDETRRDEGDDPGVSSSSTRLSAQDLSAEGLSAEGRSAQGRSAEGLSAEGRPARLVWLGRMSPEKRLLPFLEAVAESGVRAEVEVIGGGAQLAAARRLVERARPAASIVFSGRLSYPETLRRIAAADAVVQTSIGFETQGMTIFEAASLGTPSVVSDPDLAAELGQGSWTVRDASTAALADALRAAVADIEAGSAPVPDATVRERFRQSSRTAAMIEVYERVTA